MQNLKIVAKLPFALHIHIHFRKTQNFSFRPRTNKDNMGIICSTDDTQNWTKTFKGNEAEDPYNNVSFSEPAPSNPYDQGPRPSLLTSNYYPPPQTTSNAANEARGASAHPRAY